MTSTESTHSTRGPLSGVRVIELASIGPGPWAAMMLADMGAEVIRVDRPGPPLSVLPPRFDVTRRGRRSIVVDLRRPEGVALVLDLVGSVDALIEGNRPGVTERLGVGPDECLARNPALVYGRMTGWGQNGPRAKTAGHDINYIAVTGALHAMGRAGEGPAVPLNLVGDYGGGGVFLVVGVLAALLEAQRSGTGQVVDAAIVDGTLALLAPVFGMMAAGIWTDQRGVNLLDTGRPWYDVYRTADDQHVAVGALEPKFFDEFSRRIGATHSAADRQAEAGWADIKSEFAERIGTQTRQHWHSQFDGSDACVAPVLSLAEAQHDEHLCARGNFVEVAGVAQPAPAPRFSRTPATVQGPPAEAGEHSRQVLLDMGIAPHRIESLIATGVVGAAAEATDDTASHTC